LNVYYIMHERLQSFTDGKYDLERKDIENIYLEQRGDAAEQLEELGITRRMVSTAKMLQQRRTASGSLGRTSSIASRTTVGAGIDRKTSIGSKAAEAESSYVPPARTVAAPPPYTSTPSSSSIGSIKKKAPPPPPPLKAKPSFGPKYATAIFDFEPQVSRTYVAVVN
jgi:amphiphysin